MRKKKEIENAITGKYKSFHPGKVWLDTNGNPIQAHGFSVFYNAEDKTYYWYGENKEKTVGGVRCYVSKDLYNWEDKGLLIHRWQTDGSRQTLENGCRRNTIV